uniref:Rhodanese domain-containing protein CG4456-like n=1 Tax=Diabrotica virgifera virgifera TaxID=50390 RepID=A0A6P7GYH7_DIAVI
MNLVCLFLQQVILTSFKYINCHLNATPHLHGMDGMDDKVVTYSDMKRLVNDRNALIIDVREVKEVKETGLIENSINIPLSLLRSALTSPKNEFKRTYQREAPNENTLLVFTCKSGNRALKALHEAESLGFKKCRYYKGSWNEWSQKKGS